MPDLTTPIAGHMLPHLTMVAEKMTCTGCGAALSVAGSPTFVTCRFCEASLRIVRTESTVHTELREAIDDLRADVRALRGDSALRDLDRAWEIESRALMLEGKNGSVTRPTRGAAVLVGLIGPLFGGAFFAAASSHGSEIAPFGLLFALFGVGMGVYVWTRATRFDEAEQRYRDARAELEAGR